SAQQQYAGAEQPFLQRMDPPVPEIVSSALAQLEAGETPAGRTTDALVCNLAAQQRQAGNWHTGIARPPMSDADFSRTAMAIRALQFYGPEGRKADFQKRVERAAAWLSAATPKTTEDLNMQLLGLKWAGAGLRTRQEGIRRLELQQRED